MAGRGLNGVALAAVAAGVTFVYAGLTGNSILALSQSWVQGKAPSGDAAHGQIGAIAKAAEDAASSSTSSPGSGGVGAVAGAALGVAIAQDAQQYVGTGYVFGGAPAEGKWDCSSLVNKVIGMDLGLAIPFYAAGTYHGADHGPDTRAWLLWTGCSGVSGGAAAAQPGDLCCWQTHIGIAIGGGKMVSARSPHADPPTGIGDIATGGPAGQVLFVRRLNASTSSATDSGGGGGHPSAR